MGAMITPSDLSSAARSLRPILCNFICCFALTPLISLGISKLLAEPLRVGAVLLGCVSGGQASNLFALLAGGDVALSVVLTLSTTAGGLTSLHAPELEGFVTLKPLKHPKAHYYHQFYPSMHAVLTSNHAPPFRSRGTADSLAHSDVSRNNHRDGLAPSPPLNVLTCASSIGRRASDLSHRAPLHGAS